MKFVIAVACLCLTVQAQERSLQNTIQGRSNVNNDILDLLDLLPMASIRAIISKYLQNDKQVQSDFAYADSQPVEDLLTEIEATPEAQDVFDLVEQGDADLTYIINMIQDVLIVPSMPAATGDIGGEKAMLDEIYNIIPMTQIKSLAAIKYILSAPFRKLVNIITGAQFQNSLNTLLNSEKVLALENDAQTHGVDVGAILAFVDNLVHS